MAACGSTRPAHRVQGNPRAAYDWALERLERDKCLDARETLRLLSLEQAGVPYIDSIVYHLARSYLCEGDYTLAQLEFERVVNNYPSSAVVDDAAFGLAYAQFKQAPGNPGLDQQEAQRAIGTLKDFIAIYPRSDRRTEAEALLREMRERLARKAFDTGRLYLKLEADSAALIYFQKLWDEYTESPYAARALWLLAEKARKSEQWELAIQRFDQLIRVYPDAIEVERARFFLERIKSERARDLWKQAEASRRAGDLEVALARYEEFLLRYPENIHVGEARQKSESIRTELATDEPQ
jgi:outer membrane protein assembly factor BamD